MAPHRNNNEGAGKMSQICRKVVHINIRWCLVERVSILGKQFFHFIWDRIILCSLCRPVRYRRLPSHPSPLSPEALESCLGDSHIEQQQIPTTTTSSSSSSSSSSHGYDSDSDLVTLKITLLGDPQIGKTSFLIKYVGDEEETKKCLEMKGLNLIDKTLRVEGARIACTIWDVGGDYTSHDHVPLACKDAVAILFMFDLTSRCTLNSVVEWYSEARKWNQSAMLILIGTKFDDFIRLPPDLQSTIVTQARTYARAMKATLFFSSATHNINVNKIFKFVMAKLFNVPWTVQRNLTIGEPIIDF